MSKLFSKEPIRGNPWLWILKSSALGWWKIFNDLLVPAIFAVAGALIYSELDSALKASPDSVGAIFKKFGDDIMSNPALFITLLVLIFLWILSKFRKDPTISELEKINSKLEQLDTKINTILQGAKQDGESKSENPESKV